MESGSGAWRGLLVEKHCKAPKLQYTIYLLLNRLQTGIYLIMCFGPQPRRTIPDLYSSVMLAMGNLNNNNTMERL